MRRERRVLCIVNISLFIVFVIINWSAVIIAPVFRRQEKSLSCLNLENNYRESFFYRLKQLNV